MASLRTITDWERTAGRGSAAPGPAHATTAVTPHATEPSTASMIASAIALGTLTLGALTACETPAQQQAARNAEINRKAAAEINRICSLPEDQREAELKKIKDQSGMVLYCGSK